MGRQPEGGITGGLWGTVETDDGLYRELIVVTVKYVREGVPNNWVCPSWLCASVWADVFFPLQDDKKFYQLELVNRETNFNKVFNASPNVGVINPLIKVGHRTLWCPANRGTLIGLFLIHSKNDILSISFQPGSESALFQVLFIKTKNTSGTLTEETISSRVTVVLLLSFNPNRKCVMFHTSTTQSRVCSKNRSAQQIVKAVMGISLSAC